MVTLHNFVTLKRAGAALVCPLNSLLSLAYYVGEGNTMDNNIYIVESGDTLFQIAKMFGTAVDVLAAYNGIADPDVLTVGQIIRLPDGADTDCVRIHIVKSGDTLGALANKYGTTQKALAEANGITDPDKIDAGSVLRLPSGAKSRCVRVEKGDTLWDIARRHNTTVTALINENRLARPGMLRPGQVLRLPL